MNPFILSLKDNLSNYPSSEICDTDCVVYEDFLPREANTSKMNFLPDSDGTRITFVNKETTDDD